MPRIVWKAKQARLNYQARIGKTVTLKEISEQTGLRLATLSEIENNKTERVHFETLLKLCTYYGVGIGDILDIQDSDGKTLGPDLGALAA